MCNGRMVRNNRKEEEYSLVPIKKEKNMGLIRKKIKSLFE